MLTLQVQVVTHFAACRCQYVTSNSACKAEQRYIAYLQHFYCAGATSRWLLFVGYLLWMLILFYALSEVAESFLVPAVEVRACITTATPTRIVPWCFQPVFHSATLSCEVAAHCASPTMTSHHTSLCVLQWISETMKLPPAVAGVTLLSFAGGAPDLFTELAAVCTGHTHLPVNSALLSSPSPPA